MLTLIAAWINAKYNQDCDGLYALTFFLDLIIVLVIAGFLGL